MSMRKAIVALCPHCAISQLRIIIGSDNRCSRGMATGVGTDRCQPSKCFQFRKRRCHVAHVNGYGRKCPCVLGEHLLLQNDRYLLLCLEVDRLLSARVR